MPRRADRPDLSPDSPISLDEAAEICLRGLVTASTLRAAADRGELAIERLGRRIVTTCLFAQVSAIRKFRIAQSSRNP